MAEFQKPAYITELGESYIGNSLELLETLEDESINLVMTSPPFALQRKKAYGNEDQAEYIDWFTQFAVLVKKKLKPD